MHNKFIPGKFFLAIVTVTLVITLLAKASPVQATVGTWSANGSNIYYNDGKVGIGTSSPGWKFQMDQPGSTSSFLINGDGTGTTNRIFQIGNGTGKTLSFLANGNVGISTTNPSWRLQIDTVGSAGNAFLVNGDGTGTTSRLFQVSNGANKSITFLANGKVGIGTLNPPQTLSVNGTVLAKEVLVSTSASYWPDYVFESDYPLLPITELKSYIQGNKHLPGITSANEIAEAGLSLGNMQQKQMEKIEELTLYIIQQQEQI
ncbi:hypothetical protein KC640_02900, partial [Candidatus Dojkabacteria bacterium]|nr:hypothetical protein [Candidatus Dojkabacteria bacterium]